MPAIRRSLSLLTPINRPIGLLIHQPAFVALATGHWVGGSNPGIERPYNENERSFFFYVLPDARPPRQTAVQGLVVQLQHRIKRFT